MFFPFSKRNPQNQNNLHNRSKGMILPTPRLILRDFEANDWNRVFEYQSEPEYARFNSWNQRTAKDVKAFVNRFIDWQYETPRTRYQLAIVLRSEQKVIGNCGVRSTSPWNDAEIGFELDRQYWHQGYATEAANAVLEFAFTRLNLPQVRAHCVSENLASAAVLRRLGMTFEKTDRNSLWMKDQWWNTDHFVLPRTSWERSFRGEHAGRAQMQ